MSVAEVGEIDDVVVIGGGWKRFQRLRCEKEPTFDEFRDGPLGTRKWAQARASDLEFSDSSATNTVGNWGDAASSS